MTDPITPDPTEPTPAGTSDTGDTTPPADETFSWTDDRADGGASDHDRAHGDAGSATSGAAATATAVLEQIRVAIDDIAERATPTVREFSAAGGSVLLTTHSLEEAEALATRVAVIHHGRVVATGAVEDIRGRADRSLEDAFLALTR